MAQPPAADLDVLRRRLTPPERAFLDTLWTFYCDHNRWAPARLLHQHVGTTAAQAHLAGLGDGVVQTYREAGKPYYRLTFLGVLLAGQGEESEGLLVRYLEYVRDRYRADPFVEWVGSQEVEAALHLRGEQSRLLQRLIRLSHWWGGGSAFGERDWTVGVPIDVDDLLAEADLSRYVREHVLRHFPVTPQANAAPAENGAVGRRVLVRGGRPAPRAIGRGLARGPGCLPCPRVEELRGPLRGHPGGGAGGRAQTGRGRHRTRQGVADTPRCRRH